MREQLGRKIKKLVELNRAAKGNPAGFVREHVEEYVALRQAITMHLIRYPGTLVHFEDKQLTGEAIRAVNQLWASVQDRDIWDEIRYGDLGGDIQVTYSLRAKRLRPTFISVTPRQEVVSHYEQAMSAWLHGLDCAALILCCLIIEDLVKDKLFKKDPRLVYESTRDRGLNPLGREKDLAKLLRTARHESLLTQQGYRNAERIRRLRNGAVHRLKQIGEDQGFDAILDTKSLIEQLLL